MRKSIISLLLCLAVLLCAKPCYAQDMQGYIDTQLADSVGMGAEWEIIALSQSGEDYDFSACRRAIAEYMRENENLGAVTRQKLALAMLAAGGYDRRTAAVADETIGKQGIMSYVFGLHLVANGCQSSYDAEALTVQLLSMQLDDGGWALMGQNSDVDVTAMVLQAIAPHHEGDEITRALEMLSRRQGEDGSFASMGQYNAESTAQVIVALCAFGIDCRTDKRFIKNGHTAVDALALFECEGGWSHTVGGQYSAMATVQAMCANTAMQRLERGMGSLYILDGGLPELREISGGVGWKAYACAAVLLAAMGICIVLVIRKRPGRSYITLGVCTAAAIALICAVNIQSAEDYYTAQPVAEPIGTVTLSVRCDTVAGRAEHIPRDGVMLPASTVQLAEGDSVLDLLVRAAREHKLVLDVQTGTYVRSINSLGEFDFGELSGWMCLVNGRTIEVGAAQYQPCDGDVIEWIYSCSIGADI